MAARCSAQDCKVCDTGCSFDPLMSTTTASSLDDCSTKTIISLWSSLRTPRTRTRTNRIEATQLLRQAHDQHINKVNNNHQQDHHQYQHQHQHQHQQHHQHQHQPHQHHCHHQHHRHRHTTMATTFPIINSTTKYFDKLRWWWTLHSNECHDNGDGGDGNGNGNGDGSHSRSCIASDIAEQRQTASTVVHTVAAAAATFKHQKQQHGQDLCWRQIISVGFYIFLWYLSTTGCMAAKQDVPSNCSFPQRWEGAWFQSGQQQLIQIKGSSLSFRGKCIASDGDKFLMVDDKGCHRCVVIYEKHANVLQYKESECEENMYMDQLNAGAMPIQQQMRSILKTEHNRGGAHPNTNGHSRLSSSDQYLMRSNDDSDTYYCRGRETLQHLCEQIAGDALLFSMFKVDAQPVKCPLKGPFTFTYNRGNGECSSPVSNIESCTEESHLRLSFQACPDVSGTESTVEELTCLANWKDGNARYLVALVSHNHANTNEERYRCFVYEKMPQLIDGGTKEAAYKLAQSGDATCNGLESAEVGSRILTLQKAPPAERCDFPAWFKGPRHWHSMMSSSGFNFHSSDGALHITKPTGQMETRALCEQINKQTATEMMAVVHSTTGCKSGFMCMMFYRRDTHVVELQKGLPASRLEDACAPDYFDLNKLPFITLIASEPEKQVCPLDGLYGLRVRIGPPFISSRHKRNHSNKNHTHHRSHDTGHRRHSSLSFRNTDEVDQSTWHAMTRGMAVRNRRATDGRNNGIGIGNTDKDSQLERTDPQRARRDVPGCVVNYNAQRQLLIGCAKPNVIEVRPQCADDKDEVYMCHGSWTENTTVFTIVKHAGLQHSVCFSYRPLEGGAAQLVIGDSCHRSNRKLPERYLIANLTTSGKCSDTSVSNALTTHLNLIVALVLIVPAISVFR